MSNLDELEKLHELYEKKVISKEEYEKQRQQILDAGLTQTPATGRKSRLTYLLLAFFFGFLGVHNFYAGYTGRAIGQLCLTLLSLFLLSWITAIWAIIEMVTVKTDASGQPMVFE